MADENVPSAVLKERPVAKHRDLYTIRFFPAADYHWAFSKDLELLNKDKIDSFLAGPNRKKGDLRQAYEIARDPQSWNEEQNTIVHRYEQSLLDAAEEEEENEDQLEEEGDEDGEPSSKKRKRAAETGKVRESADKRKKTKASEAAKSKPEKPVSKAVSATNGEDKSEESLDPETKKVKEWRHKVQKVFLGRDGTINAEDMPSADATFSTIEEYDGMTAEHLRFTKIGKVMKRVMQLADIPRDDEFHFKDRAETLCAKWGAIMAAGDAPKSEAAERAGEPAKENGDAVPHNEAESKSEAEAAPAPASEA